MNLEHFSNKFKDIYISEGINISDNRGGLKKVMYGDKISKYFGEVKEVLCVNSIKNVVRGLHFQSPPYDIAKFITCTNGKIFDVFLDLIK